MINVLLSNARMVVARQKKAGKGSVTKRLFAASLPQNQQGDFTEAARLLKERLRKLNIRDKTVHLILGEQIIFKEFSHKPVSAKAVNGFARIEARTVLRENADAYSIGCMTYDGYVNEAGEQTTMLLAAPMLPLKTAVAAFAGSGFTLDGVHTLFGCYSAVLARALPVLAPELTGAAIDFGYEYTLINLYSKGKLVSQRRLAGILECLSGPVMEDTGCTAAEVSEKLAQNKFSPAYAAKAQAAITSFTYDILRTLRVVTAPLRIDPEKFILTGAACRDKVFLQFVIDNLGLPCVVADDAADSIRRYLAPSGSIDGLFVMAGPRYDTVDLMDDIRAKRKDAVINTGTCTLLTAVVLLGMAVQPMSLFIEKSMTASAQRRYQSLADVEARLYDLSDAKSRLAQLEMKKEKLAEYTSNTGATLPRALALFGDERFAIQQLDYDGANGAYQVSFLANTKEDFLRLKDEIYSNGEYYLNLSMSIVRQTEDGTYLCQLYFIPADFVPLPQAEEENTEQEVDVSSEDLLEGIG